MNQQQPVSKESRRLTRKVAAWVLPASGFAVLGVFFLIIFFPLGIILSLIAIAIVAANVLWKSTDDVLETSDQS